MSETNDPVASPADRLSRMLAYDLTQMIHVVVKLGVPDVLATGPRSVDELAVTVKAHARSLHRVLRALASQGVFAEEATGRFALTPVSELLRSDAPASLRPFALSYGEPWWWNAWGGLLHSVRTGETAFDSVHGMGLFEFLDRSRDAASVFSANMTAMTAGEAQAVVTAYDFSRTRVLVDVGGGQGALASAIVRANPQVHAVVFDLPSVVEGLRPRLEAAGVEKRCEIVGGSFFESVPAGGDTYTLKDILHDWDDERAIAILRNCRQAMGPSARLLVIERVVLPGNEAMLAKRIDVSMLVMTGGRERTDGEYRALLDATGFRLKQIFPSDAETSVIEAIPT